MLDIAAIMLPLVRQKRKLCKKGVEHGMKEHGLKQGDITPELKQKIKGLIRTT
jgi:hypothetical protein